MGGLLSLIGIVLIVLGFNGVERCGVIGVVVLFFGIMLYIAKAEDVDMRARINRKQYWANRRWTDE